MAATTTGESDKEYRLHISDQTTSQKFLIDSGSAVSVIPRTYVGRMNASPFKLYAANSTVINTYGQKLLTLNLGLRRECQWPFIIADVKTAIIGTDFIAHHNLLIDLGRQRLIDSVTSLSSQGKFCKTTQPSLSTVNASQPHSTGQSSSYARLLAEYADITKPNFGERTEATTQVAHHIVTNGHPVALRPWKLAGEKLAAAKQQINAMLQQGILAALKQPVGQSHPHGTKKIRRLATLR